jgi:hypothetical protein
VARNGFPSCTSGGRSSSGGASGCARGMAVPRRPLTLACGYRSLGYTQQTLLPRALTRGDGSMLRLAPELIWVVQELSVDGSPNTEYT